MSLALVLHLGGGKKLRMRKCKKIIAKEFLCMKGFFLHKNKE